MDLRKYFVWLVLAALPMLGSAKSIYVAVSGTNSGTGPIGAPYKTIQYAYSQAAAGDTIYVRGGTYREAVSLTGKSGSAGSPITLTSYTNETAILSGLDVQSLTWTSTNLPRVTNAVYVAAYSGAVFDQMFFDGKPQLEARWPSVPKDASGDWDFFSPDLWSTVNTNGNNYGIVQDTHLAVASGTNGWNRSITGVRAVLNVSHQYTTWTRVVTNHTVGYSTFYYPTNLGTSVTGADETGGGISFNDDRYYLVGEKDFLDVPGEWYNDTVNHLLYLCPPCGKNPNAALVEIKTRNYSFTADQNSSYLTVDGITFLGTAFSFGKGVTSRSSNIILRNNTVLYSSWTEWLNMPAGDPHENDDENYPEIQADNSQVANNTFEYGALSGLLINGWTNQIENNVFDGFDLSSSLSYPPLIVSRNWASYDGNGGQATVRYNTLCNSGGILMHVGQTDNDVYQNQLYHAFRACWGGNKDVAALYTQSPYAIGTRLHHNWVYDSAVGTSPQPWNGGLGLRGDDSTCGVTMDHNVAWNLGSAGIMLKNVTNPVPEQANGCYNNTIFYHNINNTTNSAIIIQTSSGQNSLSAVANNMAQQIYGGWNAGTLGTLALYASNSVGITAESQLENIGWFDFRPAASSDSVINKGVVVSNITGTTIGAPDIGAYERGSGVYWIPGQRGGKATFPIVPDGAAYVPVDRDVLMWRPAYNAASNRVWFGTSQTGLQHQAEFGGETNVFSLPALSQRQTYYWRVDAVMPDASVVQGEVWSFSTASAWVTNALDVRNGGTNSTPGDSLNNNGSYVFANVTLSVTGSPGPSYSGFNSFGVNSSTTNDLYEEIETYEQLGTAHSNLNEKLTFGISFNTNLVRAVELTGVTFRNLGSTTSDAAIVTVAGVPFTLGTNTLGSQVWSPAGGINLTNGTTLVFKAGTNTTASYGIVYLSFGTIGAGTNTYTLTYSAGTNGTLSGTSPQTVTNGMSGTAVSAVPDAGCHFVNWSDGITSNPRTDSNVTNDITVSANFAINTYTLTYTAGTNGTISGTATQTVNFGASGTAVTAIPDAGYRFVNWSDGVTNNPRTDLNVTNDITVAASFVVSGTITHTDIITNAGSGIWVVPAGVTTVTVELWGAGGIGGNSGTGIPGAGGGGGGGAYTITNLPVTPGASNSYSVGAGAANANGSNTTFGATTASGGLKGGTGPTGAGGAGGIGGTCNGGTGGAGSTNIGLTAASGGGGGGAGSVGNGGNASGLTAGAGGSPDGGTGAAGRITDGPGVAGTAPGGGGSGAVQLTGGSSAGGAGANGQIRLTYQTVNTNTYTLTYAAGANGTVSGTATQTVNSGASGTAVTAVPDTGCHFVNWSDGVTNNPRTDLNVTNNITVSANFAVNAYTLWAASYNLGVNAGETNDPDGDGLNNLCEYALGGNPTNPSDRGYVPIFRQNGATFDYVYARRTGSSGDLNYYLELTDRLVSGIWSNGGYSVIGTSALTNGFESVTNRISTAGTTNGFIRLRIGSMR